MSKSWKKKVTHRWRSRRAALTHERRCARRAGQAAVHRELAAVRLPQDQREVLADVHEEAGRLELAHQLRNGS